MGKHRFSLLLCTLLTVAAPAAADDADLTGWSNKRGSVGVGANRTLSGLSGVAIRSWITKSIGLQGTVGLDYSSTNTDDGGAEDKLSTLRFGVSAGALVRVVTADRGSLSAVLDADVEVGSTTVETGGNSSSSSEAGFAIGAGLQGEWFLARQISVYAQTGIRLRLLTDDDAGDLAPETDSGIEVSGVAISPTADLLAAAGFSIWF